MTNLYIKEGEGRWRKFADFEVSIPYASLEVAGYRATLGRVDWDKVDPAIVVLTMQLLNKKYGI